MRRSTRTLLLALGLGAIVASAGAAYSSIEHRRSEQGQATCEASFKSATPSLSGKEVPPWDMPDWARDAKSDLADGKTRGESVDAVFARLDAEQKAHDALQVCSARFDGLAVQASAVKMWAGIGGVIIAVLGALPWLWYGLLRRVAELRAAIAGKPPDG